MSAGRLHREILEQPDAARRLIAGAGSASARLKAVFARRRPAYVVIAARGSSDHAALYAQYLLGIRNRLPVALATPSAVTLYGAQPQMADGLVVGISQSGQSPDIVAVLAEARRQGALTLAITNVASSPLAAAAAELLELQAGVEQATAATKTYTTELLAVALLSFALDDGTPNERQGLAGIAGRMEEALAIEPIAERLALERRAMSRCVVLGRGYEYATAREWALKLQELARVLALAFSAADFEHGPIALAEDELDVLAVAPAGPPLEAQADLLRRLAKSTRVRQLVISEPGAADGAADDGRLPLPVGVPGWLAPAVSIIPAQLFTYHLTLAKGLDADRPSGISKVTQTR
jgi:glucosamine--fructose-6-phosphate aminotransferase (isomerizing)